MSTHDDHPTSSITEFQEEPEQEPEVTEGHKEETPALAEESQQETTPAAEQPMNQSPMEQQETQEQMNRGEQQQRQPQLPGGKLADMFSRLSETMVYAIAPPDDLVTRIVDVCSALESTTHDVSLENYVTLFNEACWVNRILRAYRHRARLYSLEERVLLNAANVLITQWREDVNGVLRSSQQQQEK